MYMEHWSLENGVSPAWASERPRPVTGFNADKSLTAPFSYHLQSSHVYNQPSSQFVIE